MTSKPMKRMPKRRRNGPRGTRGSGRSRMQTKSGPSLGIGGTPSMVSVQLLYVQETKLSTTTTVGQSFRGNGPYDPDATSTGGQPINYDDYSIFYNRYRVQACRMEWVFVPSTSAIFKLTCTPNNGGSSIANTATAIGLQWTKWRAGINGTQINDGARGAFVKQRHTTKAVLGEDWGDRFESLNNNVPADQWYWTFLLESSDATSTVTGYLTTKITYEMTWFDRNNQGLDLAERKLIAAKKFYVLEKKKAELNALTQQMKTAKVDWNDVQDSEEQFDTLSNEFQQDERDLAGLAVGRDVATRADEKKGVETAAQPVQISGGSSMGKVVGQNDAQRVSNTRLSFFTARPPAGSTLKNMG